MPGLVTQCPNFIVDVACTASVRSGNDSCQSTCESYVQPYSKPFDSACWISSRKRLVGRVGQDGNAEAQGHLGFSFARSESGIIDPRAAWREAESSVRGPERSDHREREATVARQLERETGQRRADEDREHRACVDERDRRTRARPDEPLRGREDHREGEAGREPEHERADAETASDPPSASRSAPSDVPTRPATTSRRPRRRVLRGARRPDA